MRALDLDYLTERRPRWAAYALAVFALGFAADAALHFRALSTDVAAKELRAARRTSAPASPATPSLTSEEQAFAKDTVRRLTTPWEALFRALEAVQTENVALLAIEPDLDNRTVNISGEAKDYLGALTYVAQLGDQEGLSRVHLVRHEMKSGSPRPLVFQVSASWKDRRQ